MPLNKNDLLDGSKKILGSDAGKLGVVLILLVLSFQFGSCNNEKSWDERYRDFRDSAQVAATTFSDSVQLVVDSALAAADSATVEAESITSDIDELRKENERLKELGGTIINPIPLGDLPPVCNLCVARLDSAITALQQSRLIITNLENTVEAMENRDQSRLVTIASLRSAVTAQTFKADSLQQVIINMPQPRPAAKLLGLFKISPTASAILGAGAGLVTGVMITRN